MLGKHKDFPKHYTCSDESNTTEAIQLKMKSAGKKQLPVETRDSWIEGCYVDSVAP